MGSKYFVVVSRIFEEMDKDFIENPKNKKLGDLCLCLRLLGMMTAQLDSPPCYGALRNLKRQNIDIAKRCIKIHKNVFYFSMGFASLLQTMCEDLKPDDRVFPNLRPRTTQWYIKKYCKKLNIEQPSGFTLGHFYAQKDSFPEQLKPPYARRW